MILGPLSVIREAMSQTLEQTCRISDRLALEKDFAPPDIAMEV